MTRSGDQALDQALAFHRAPGYLTAIRRQALPEDLQTLLRIAAGDSEASLQAAQSTGESPEALREVVIFYLQQMLFADDGDSYRVLGVNADASDEQIKLHYRWLARWLHPDRNPDEWESVFADRVNRAWQDLRTPTRRNAYDLSLSEIAPQVAVHARQSGLPQAQMEAPSPLLSAHTVRWLPTIVLSTFGLFAVVALAVLYKMQVVDQEVQATNAAAVTAGPADNTHAEFAPAAAAVNVDPVTAAPPVATVPIVSAPMPLPVAVVDHAIAAPMASPMIMPIPAQSPAITETVKMSEESAPKNSSGKASESVVVVQAIRKQSDQRAIVSPPVTMAPVPAAVLNRTTAVVSNRIPAPQSSAQENVAIVNMQPITPSASAQNANDDRGLIDDRIAASLVSRFSQAYANGDMNRLMQLFTHDAHNGRGDRRAIAEDYRRLFEASDRRRIALSDMSWLTLGDGATIIASFETEVVPHGKTHGEHDSGDIRFDLREEDGELRIYRLSHDNRRS